MRVLYFDCFNGASGDMVLGALLDAGLPLEELRRALGSLAIDGASVSSTKVLRAGVSATKLIVEEHDQDHGHGHHHGPAAVAHRHSHRTLAEISLLIGQSSLSAPARQRARNLFQRLGEAEASIHQTPIEKIHLHEVGALDSIIDIVGAVFAIEWFGADRVISSPLNVGGGMVESAHGTFPVPAPATVKLLTGVPVYSSGVQSELVTPTGALLVTDYAASYGPVPPMTVEQIGYGAGSRDLPGTPNVLRVLVGQASEQAATEQIVVINCEIDDMNPQLFGLVMDRLYVAGALEVYFAPVQMKKNRPGTLLTILARPEQRQELSSIVFHETTTIGVRYHEVTRERLDREIVPVETPYGEVHFKVARLGGRVVNASPEFEDCLRLASERKVPVKDVQAAASKAYLDARDGGLGIRVPRFYLTTAIDYVNSVPHLGTAYEKVCADVITRYKRLSGYDTFFLMGNDEHSQNVFRSATEQGLDPLAYCDRMEDVFQTTWRSLDLSYDDFIRTTQARHKTAVTELVQRIHDAGDIYEGVYEGWYCVGCEAFKPEKELVNGRCPLHPQTEPQWIKEKNYFFRLSKYQQRLLDLFVTNPGFFEPAARRNEQLRLLEGGLEDISISRAGQSWGIPLPWDPKSVVYVWFDALVNYAAAVGLGADRARFDAWWPADVHLIGKDITRFHTVIWPAMLMSAGLPLPHKVFAHGFMSLDGQRMSKSAGTIVDPLVAAGRHGVDALRLYLVREVVFGDDGDFAWERFDEKYNSDLANNLGNLVSRVTVMANQYREGRLAPTGEPSAFLAGVAADVVAAYQQAMNALDITSGAAHAFRLVDAANLHIAQSAPWALAKDPSKADQLSQVLFDAAEAIRLSAVLLSPILPRSALEILKRVGAASESLSLEADGQWRATGERRTILGTQLWPRFDVKKIKEPPVSPENLELRTENRISIDDFKKVELRTARVLAAEAVPKSKKLLKLQVDLGTEQRTILAGIAEAYQPDSLVGRTIVVVANLAPAKLMGIESNGMVLAADTESGQPVLLSVEAEPGWQIR